MTSKMPSRRALAQQRRLNVIKRGGVPPEDLRPTARVLKPKVVETLVERDDTGAPTAIMPAGLAMVERLAGQGAPQSKIAARLGLLHKQFKNLLGAKNGDNDIRLAWERGHAEFEHDIVKKLLKHGKHSFVPLIFLGKARLGWVETGQAAAAQIQNNVQLVLPKSRTREEYFAMLGIVDPQSLATPRTEPMKLIGQQPALPAPEPIEPQPEKETIHAEQSET
jgi:hypothetical protein